MKTTFALILLSLGTGAMHVYAVEPVGTSFTYQGRLNYQGAPADGPFTFEFGLYDAEVSGNQIGTTVSVAAEVEGGLFNASLDFGGTAFVGDKRWLECALIPDAGAQPIVLPPRAEVAPAPHAQFAAAAADALSLGGVAAESYSKFNWELVSSNVQAQVDTGYLTTGTDVIQVQLPGDAEIGDTFKVSSAGHRGWRITQAPQQSIVCMALGISKAQQLWTERSQSIPFGPYILLNRSWRDVTASADGKRIVAVTAEHVFTSNDGGSTWFDHHTANVFWRCVDSSADGKILLGAADNGYLYVSADYGVSWSIRDSQRNWRAVFVSADGTRMAAIGNSNIFVSSDSGVTWAQRQSLSADSICGSTDGKRLAVPEVNRLWISDDYGVTWTYRTTQFPNYLRYGACSADGNFFAVVSHYGVMISEDRGDSWVRTDFGYTNLTDVAVSDDGSRVTVVGGNMKIYTSMDRGHSWIERDQPRNWSAIAMSADGKHQVACVNVGFIYTSEETKLSKTTPGPSGFLIGGTHTALELQYIGNNAYMPISHIGVIGGN